jgi:hypothetical protein
MRKYLLRGFGLPLLGLLLFWPSQANATISVVQHVGQAACGTGTTCSITVTAIGVGHVVFVGFGADALALSTTISSVTVAGTYAHCSNCHSTDASNNQADISTISGTTGGETIVTVTISNSAAGGSWSIDMMEISSGLALSLDTSSSGTDADCSCTTYAGVALTLGGSNDAIYQIGSPQHSVTAISGAYTTVDLPNGVGFGLAINTSVGTAPNWTVNTTGNMAVAAIAFKEASAATGAGVGGKAMIGGKAGIG